MQLRPPLQKMWSWPIQTITMSLRYTDASSTQLGSVITQDNRPLAFFSRKLSETQQKYSVTEIELLAIVETLSSKACCGARNW